MAQYLSNLSTRALLKFGKHKVGSETAQPIIWMVADKNHSGFPSNSVTLITQKIIDLRAYDAMEDTTETSFDTETYYPPSNINVWLNSEAASNWYTKQNSGDNPPNADSTTYNTPYNTRPGFLYNFTSAERSALLPTTLTLTKINSAYPSMSAKVFLPTLKEVLGTSEVDDNTTRFACFTSGAVTCGITSQAFTNTTCTNKPTSVDVYWKYFTRSAANNDIYSISATGTRTNISTYDGSGGIRPVINLSANTKISSTPDADGCYTVLTQTVPVISGSNSDIGIKSSAFSHTYSVSDADGDSVTAKEYIDNVLVRSYVPTLGATNTFSVSGETWLKLANGSHTLKIVVNDGFDEVTRTFTFTKSVTKLTVQRATPLDSSTMPKAIRVTVVKNIPEEADFKVEVCNNGYDASPTWEDITDRVIAGRVYDFNNTTKTATKWGVNIRVTIDRNGAEGACYITEIGGNFE